MEGLRKRFSSARDAILQNDDEIIDTANEDSKRPRFRAALFVVALLSVWTIMWALPSFIGPRSSAITTASDVAYLDRTHIKPTSEYDHFYVALVDGSNRNLQGNLDLQLLNVAANQGVAKVGLVNLDLDTHTYFAAKSTRQALKFGYSLAKAFPDLNNVKWFLYTFTGTPKLTLDSYVFMENIRLFLKNVRSEDPSLFHNLNSTDSANISRESEERASSILILSHGAVGILVSKCDLYIACVNGVSGAIEVGNIIRICLLQIGIGETRVDRIHNDDPIASSEWNFNPCDTPLAISRVMPGTLSALCPSNNGKHTCHKSGTYSSLFYNGYYPVSTNMHRVDPMYWKTGVFATVGECVRFCDANPECLSWSFDPSEGCFLNNNVPNMHHHVGGVSGICRRRFVCGKMSAGPCNEQMHANLYNYNPDFLSEKSRLRIRYSQSSGDLNVKE